MDWLEPAEYAPWRRLLEIERRAGHLTPHRRDCLRALLCFFGTEGLWPSDQAVADLAGHSVSTVRRARLDARALGLLTWAHTRKTVAGRRVQGPNCYTIRVPSPLACSDVQRERVRQVKKKTIANPRQVAPTRANPRQFTPSGTNADARAALAALAAVAARRMAAIGERRLS